MQRRISGGKEKNPISDFSEDILVVYALFETSEFMSLNSYGNQSRPPSTFNVLTFVLNKSLIIWLIAPVIGQSNQQAIDARSVSS